LKTEKILVINPFGIGDVLFTTPLLRRLKNQFRNSFIGFICNSRVRPIISGNKNIDEVFVFDKGYFRDVWRESKISGLRQFFSLSKVIKSKKFDIAIDLSLGHQYAFFLRLLGVPRVLGYNFKNRGRFLTSKIDIAGYHDKHIVEYYLDLLDLLNVETPQWSVSTSENLEIFVPEEDMVWADSFLKNNNISQNDKIAMIVPGGGASWGKTAIYKQWPAENFAELADALADKYKAKLIIVGGQADFDVCDTVLRAMRNKPICAYGKTSLLQLAALFKKSSLAICNDGGPLHIAVAAGLKTVSIFGPVDENVYGPYPLTEEHVVMKEDINCRPCYREFKFQQCAQRRCLLNIRVQDVLKAAGELL